MFYTVNNIKMINKDITMISDINIVVIDQVIMMNIKKETTDVIIRINKIGTNNSAFISFTLQEKKAYVTSNWPVIKVNNADELLISKDGVYLFECEFYIGIRPADKNIKKM